jgi:hypothetical protein
MTTVLHARWTNLEALTFVGHVDAKRVVEGDHVVVEEILAAQAGVDAVEEEGEGEDGIEVQVLVDGEGRTAAVRGGSSGLKHAKLPKMRGEGL